MKVFITGSAAHLANALLPRLCDDPRITHVTGVDKNVCTFVHPKFDFHQTDIRDERIRQWMHAHDALIHLAFVVLRGKMRLDEMHDVNVTSSLDIFQHARACGITRLLHLSSASVYGHGTDLDEQAALSPISGFVYAEHKTELETQLHRIIPDVLCLRPHIILGPHALPLLKSILKMPFYIKMNDPQPLLQCVHEQDVARAIHLALFSSLSGALNLASREALSFRDFIRINRPRAIGMPLGLAQATLNLVWRMSGWGGEPAWLSGARRPLTLNCERAHRELNWQPEYSTRAAIQSVLAKN